MVCETIGYFLTLINALIVFSQFKSLRVRTIITVTQIGVA